MKNRKDTLPLVSIIIPVYNGEDYIDLAIESALRQTYKNIEIIVVNDGSKDNTEKICKKYGNLIKYFKKENGGVSTALNLGVENMNGSYFSWLSHDDIYLPNKIETEINYLKNNNLLYSNTILYSNYGFIDENSNFNMVIRKFNKLINQNSAYAIYMASINGLTLLIPKQAFIDTGLFDEKLRCVQDYQLWFDMYKKGYKYIHIPDVLTFTRRHSKSVTNTSPKVITEGNNFWLNVIKYFNDKQKIQLEGSVYDYYNYIYNRFINEPYNELLDYCKNEIEKIEKENKKKVDKYKVCTIISFINNIDATIKSIKSVLKQSFKNIKIILINNNSTESTEKIEKIISNNKDIIKYIKLSSNNKLEATINKEIEASDCDYFCLLESGSIFKPKKIEIQLLKTICSCEDISFTSFYNEEKEKDYYYGKYTGLMDLENINYHCVNKSTVMIKKDLLIKYINKKIFITDFYYFLENYLKNTSILGIYEVLVSIPYQEKYPKVNKYNYDSIKSELKRYQYLQSDEYKMVKRIRYGLFRKKRELTYNMDYNKLRSGKIAKIVKKYEKIKNSIFVRSKKK